MASRHLSRSAVLQALFEGDVSGLLTHEATQAILKRNLTDFSHGDIDTPFAEDLLRGIIDKRTEIDAIMVKAAPQWPLEKIAPIDRNILRIGLYELLFGDRDATPPKVALNESIELGKSFGGDATGKFVNGVLGAVYRDIGEPGKEETKTPIPLPHQALGGVVLVAFSEGKIHIALVHDAFGRWTLPKAKCREGELSDAAAMRALKEELGVDAPAETPIGEHKYIAHEPGVGRIARTVGYYLAVVSKTVPLACKECAGISEVKWFAEDELPNIPTYNDLLPIIENGIAIFKSS